MANPTNSVLIGKETHFQLGDASDTLTDFSNRVLSVRLNVNRNSGSSTGLGDDFDSSRPTMNSASMSIDFLATGTNQSFLLGMQSEFDKERLFELGRQGNATGKPKETGQCYLETVDWNASVGSVQTYSCTLKVNSYVGGTQTF